MDRRGVTMNPNDIKDSLKEALEELTNSDGSNWPMSARWDWENDFHAGLQKKQQQEPKTKPKKNHNTGQIAEAIMDELVLNGLEDLLILKNLQVGEWWSEVTERRDRIAKAKLAKQLAKEKADEEARKKEEILSRLTDEEKRLLGLK